MVVVMDASIVGGEEDIELMEGDEAGGDRFEEGKCYPDVGRVSYPARRRGEVR